MAYWLIAFLDYADDLMATSIGSLAVVIDIAVVCIIDAVHNTDYLNQHRELEDAYRYFYRWQEKTGRS